MLTVTLCRSECCVPSGLDFEAARDSVVRYFVCNYLLRGLRVTVNMTWRSFVVKYGNSRKSAHPPLWQTCKVLRSWVFFREATVVQCCCQGVLVLSSIVLVLSNTFLMSSFCYGYMFMNKISMSQTCLYNFSYKKKLPDFYNNQYLQRAFGYSSA